MNKKNLYLGWIIGPTTGGILSDHLGFSFTFALCTGLTLSGLVLALFFIPPKIPRQDGPAAAAGPGRPCS